MSGVSHLDIKESAEELKQMLSVHKIAIDIRKVN